jgi:SAM-dependent methyltransferase
MEKVFASTVALVVVVSVHFGLEKNIEVLVGNRSVVAEYVTAGLAIVLGIIALLFLEYLSKNLYESSGYVRYFVHWLDGKPYLEGWWVDVGVDESAGIPEILSYSFIIILYDKTELKIEGLTWETRSIDRHYWDSMYSATKELDLYFEYNYTSLQPNAPSQGHETANYHFMMDRNSFEGKYDGNKFTSHGQIKRLNKKLFGSNYKFPNHEQREQYANIYWNYYIRKYGFDPYTFRRRVLSQHKARREDSFVRFVKQSNSKASEVELLNKALQSVSWSSSIRSILDLGAGEGTLTIPALKALKFDSRAGKYVGIDSNGILLEALSTRLKNECGRKEDNNTILIRRTIDDFVLNDMDRFDVILACHSIYFVDNVSSVLSEIFTRKLENGGRFIAMHTDIMSQKAKFIKTLAGHFNHSLKLDTITQIKNSAEGAGMVCLFEFEADITLRFPHLDPRSWIRVADNGEGDDVAKVIELISFLIDRGPDQFENPIEWKDCVQMVQTRLDINNDQIVFPIVSQVFEKPLI